MDDPRGVEIKRRVIIGALVSCFEIAVLDP